MHQYREIAAEILSKNAGTQTRGAAFLAFQPKGQDPAVQQFQTDGTGIHTAQTKIVCDQSGCETKVCRTPCGEIQSMVNNGHYSHKPPVGSQSEFLDAQDFKGKVTPNGQHFVKSSTPTKPTLTSEQLKNLTENDMVPNKAADAYSALPHILPKVQ